MASKLGYLTIIFRGTLTFALSQQPSTPVLHVGNRTYIDRDKAFWYGFYDWLRDHQGRVLGVRNWKSVFPSAYDFEQICASLSKYPYVEVSSRADHFNVYFSPDRNVDQHESGDAEFEENRILVSADGDYAITFGLSSMEPEPENMERIKTFDVARETAVWENE